MFPLLNFRQMLDRSGSRSWKILGSLRNHRSEWNKSGFGALLSPDLVLCQLSQPKGFHHYVGAEHFNLRAYCILQTTDKTTQVECIKKYLGVISYFLKFFLILSHSASLEKFGECSCEAIKRTRAKSMQKELGKICPIWLCMSLDVPTEPLKCFMLQMNASGTLLTSKLLCTLKYCSSL